MQKFLDKVCSCVIFDFIKILTQSYFLILLLLSAKFSFAKIYNICFFNTKSTTQIEIQLITNI